MSLRENSNTQNTLQDFNFIVFKSHQWNRNNEKKNFIHQNLLINIKRWKFIKLYSEIQIANERMKLFET